MLFASRSMPGSPCFSYLQALFTTAKQLAGAFLKCSAVHSLPCTFPQHFCMNHVQVFLLTCDPVPGSRCVLSLQALYTTAKQLADAVIPSEYGLDPAGKLRIGSKVRQPSVCFSERNLPQSDKRYCASVWVPRMYMIGAACWQTLSSPPSTGWTRPASCALAPR